MLDAALRCFAADGVASTTLSDVADAAGVHRVTVHRVFPGGRAELLRAVIARVLAPRYEPVGEMVAAATDPAVAVTELILLAIRILREDPVLADALGTAIGRQAVTLASEDALSELVLAAWERVRELARSRGWFVIDDPGLVRVIDHLARTIAGLAFDPTAPHDDEGLRRYLDDFVTPGLVRRTA